MLAQKTGENALVFLYDDKGAPFGFRYNAATYYYTFNAQGDVTGILDHAGNPVARYTYDEWGSPLTITDATGADVSGNPAHIANINPLRYRAYYFDAESGLYYLQSRYYDPTTCRFINADAYASTGQGIFGNNMYAYCANNPVIYSDESGHLFGLVIGICIIAGGMLFLSGCAANTSPSVSVSTSTTTTTSTNNSNSATGTVTTTTTQSTVPISNPKIEVYPNKTPEQKKEFVDAVYARAKIDEVSTGIPAALMTAQACLESGYGTSPAAINNNNLFRFVGFTFDSIDESIASYEGTLMNNSRYKHLHGGTLSEWVNGIGPAGYCPDPGYATALWGVIKTWDLK